MKEIAEHISTSSTTVRLEHKRSKQIWFCWLQGIENAPEVVKACYRSLQRHLGIAGQARDEGYEIMHEQRGADGAAGYAVRLLAGARLCAGLLYFPSVLLDAAGCVPGGDRSYAIRLRSPKPGVVHHWGEPFDEAKCSGSRSVSASTN